MFICHSQSCSLGWFKLSRCCQSLWAHIHIHLIVCGKHHLLEFCTTSELTTFLLLLWHRSLCLEWRGLIKRCHLELSAPNFHSLHIVQLWVSVLIAIYCTEKYPWWGLSDVLIYGYSCMSSWVILLLCLFSRMIAICFPLGLRLTWQQVHGPLYQCQVWVSSCGVGWHQV